MRGLIGGMWSVSEAGVNWMNMGEMSDAGINWANVGR